MNFQACRHEHDVQAAAMSGRWPAPVAQHARDCASCRDLRRIVEVLQTPVPSAAPAVDASALWVCGRHARRIAAEARVSTIVALGQLGALAGLLVVLVAFVRSLDLWSMLVRVIQTDPRISIAVLTGVLVLGVSGLAWWISMATRPVRSNASTGN